MMVLILRLRHIQCRSMSSANLPSCFWLLTLYAEQDLIIHPLKMQTEAKREILTDKGDYIHWLHLLACIRRSHIWYRPRHLPSEDMP